MPRFKPPLSANALALARPRQGATSRSPRLVRFADKLISAVYTEGVR